MQIAPSVHHFATGPFNWYVLEQDSRLTLVDAGFPGHYRTFLAGLASINRSISDVEAIIVTHAHADHMGFAERVRRETGAPLYVHSKDLRAVEQRYPLPWWGLLSHAYIPYMAGMLANAVFSGLVLQPGISQARSVTDGQQLEVPGRPIVLHAPGHTPGQIALHLPQHRVLLSSDVIITRDLITGRYGLPQLAHASLNTDIGQARRSLPRLKELGKVTLLPGHGRPWTGEIAEAISLAGRTA